MRVGPIAHGALLVAALGFAYQTWTREKTESPKVGTVTVWNESVDSFQSFAYDGENKSVRVERRADGGESYFWGQVTRTEKKRKPKVPVKSAPGDNSAGPTADDGHGGARPGRPVPPRPGAAPGKTEPGKTEPAKAPGKTEPARTGGADAKAPARSPHQSGTDPDQAKPAAPPSKGASPAGASPAKPGDKPAASGADKPAAAPGADKPAAPSGGAGDDAEGEDTGEDAAGTPEAAPEPEETTSTTKEFPIGKGGQELIANLSHLHALRDLGVLNDKQKEDYGLNESKENLTVFFKGGKQHSLVIGSRVFGGGDRYVVDPATGHGYVLSNSEIMRHIDGAENSLGLKDLHEFDDESSDSGELEDEQNPTKAKKDHYPGVTQVQIETPSGARTLVRYEHTEPTTGNTIVGWADKQKPKEADVTFGNLLTQIERLKPLEYDTSLDPSGLTKVLTLRYVKSDGKTVGTFELLKKEPAVTPEVEPSEESKKDNQPEYYVKTELTRVLGKVGRMSAERVADDLPQLFGAPPKEKPVRANPPGSGAVPGAAPAKPGAAPAGTATPKPADNPGKPAQDKTEPARPGSPKPAGSKPNPTEGNK